MFSNRFGGPVTMVADAAEVLAGLGVQSTIFATDLGKAPWAKDWRSVLPEELPANADVLDYELFPVKAPHRLLYSPGLAARLNEVVKDFDLVHIHSLWLHPQYAAQHAARKAGVPYIVSLHGALDPYLRQRGRLRKAATSKLWQDGMLEHAELLHVTTQAEQDLTDDIAPAVPRYTVANGTWVDRLAPADADGARFRQEFLSGFDGPLAVFLGRINFKKGLELLIDSFKHVVATTPDAQLAIIGPDDEGLLASLEARVAELGLGEHITFTGALYDPHRTDALAAADVWCLSSHSENFGIAVIEAMAAGCATVISPAVNLADEVIREDAGIVAELDPQKFGAAISDLFADPTRRAEYAASGARFARKFDWPVVGPQLIEMYEQAVDS
ncbi:MAG: glycosyltransferase [Thermoleophilaceae bacterium]|nr:glycosyltransferase [Thermoleophilaceae bacterium]